MVFQNLSLQHCWLVITKLGEKHAYTRQKSFIPWILSIYTLSPSKILVLQWPPSLAFPIVFNITTHILWNSLLKEQSAARSHEKLHFFGHWHYCPSLKINKTNPCTCPSPGHHQKSILRGMRNHVLTCPSQCCSQGREEQAVWGTSGSYFTSTFKISCKCQLDRLHSFLSALQQTKQLPR